MQLLEKIKDAVATLPGAPLHYAASNFVFDGDQAYWVPLKDADCAYPRVDAAVVEEAFGAGRVSINHALVMAVSEPEEEGGADTIEIQTRSKERLLAIIDRLEEDDNYEVVGELVVTTFHGQGSNRLSGAQLSGIINTPNYYKTCC